MNHRLHFLAFGEKKWISLLKVEGFFISNKIQTWASSENCLQIESIFANKGKNPKQYF